MIPELIYCADGNKRFARIAIDAGFTYGAKLPYTIYFDPEFCDQDWKHPNREEYLGALAQRQPRLATVLDWERWDQLNEVLGWAEEAAAYVSEAILIVPKVIGGIAYLPRSIGGRPIRLAYSVSSGYGSTPCHPKEFYGYGGIHLLGGCPMNQKRLSRLFASRLNISVVSADGNYALKMATRHNQYFVPAGDAYFARNRFWPTLKEANGGQPWGDGSPTTDAPYEAFRRSCEAIMAMWQGRPRAASYKQYFLF